MNCGSFVICLSNCGYKVKPNVHDKLSANAAIIKDAEHELMKTCVGLQSDFTLAQHISWLVAGMNSNHKRWEACNELLNKANQENEHLRAKLAAFEQTKEALVDIAVSPHISSEALSKFALKALKAAETRNVETNNALLNALIEVENDPKTKSECDRFAAFRKVTQKDLDTRVD